MTESFRENEELFRGASHTARSASHSSIVDEALRLFVLAAGTSPNHCEKPYLHKDGHVVWGLLAASVVRTRGRVA